MKAYVVDSAAVRSNLQQLQTRAGSAVLWAVLKGDGYGLGLLPMAAICREAGVTHFAVTEVSEVSRLRAGGFADASILMLRPTSEQDELRQLLQLGAILTVSSQNDAAVLNGVAQAYRPRSTSRSTPAWAATAFCRTSSTSCCPSSATCPVCT